MKRNIFMLGILLLGAAWGLTACSDSDDADSNMEMAGKIAGVVSEDDGILLTSVGAFEFTYDDQGRLTSVTNTEEPYNDQTFTIDYKAKTVTETYGSDTKYVNKATFTPEGYVSRLYRSTKMTNYNVTDDYKFEYDANHHLVKFTNRYMGSETYSDGTKDTWDYQEAWTWTWVDGRCTKQTYDYSNNFGGIC